MSNFPPSSHDPGLPTQPPKPGDKTHHPTRAYIINGREEMFISSDESGDEMPAMPQRRKQVRGEEVDVKLEVPEIGSDSSAHHYDDQLEEDNLMLDGESEELKDAEEVASEGSDSSAYHSDDQLDEDNLMLQNDEESEGNVTLEGSDSPAQRSEEHLDEDNLMLNDEDSEGEAADVSKEEADSLAHQSDDQVGEDNLMLDGESEEPKDIEEVASEGNDSSAHQEDSMQLNGRQPSLPTQPPRPGDKTHHPTRSYIINGREEFYISSDESGDEMPAEKLHRMEVRDEEVEEEEEEEVPEEGSDSPARRSDDQLDDEDNLMLQNDEEPSLPTQPPKPGDKTHHPTRSYIINGREEFYISSDESGDETPAVPQRRKEARDEKLDGKEEIPEERSDSPARRSEERHDEDGLVLRNNEEPSLPTQPPRPGDTRHHPTRAYIINGREEFYISSDESGDEMPAEKLNRMEVRDEEVEEEEEVPEKECDSPPQHSEEQLEGDDSRLLKDEEPGLPTEPPKPGDTAHHPTRAYIINGREEIIISSDESDDEMTTVPLRWKEVRDEELDEKEEMPEEASYPAHSSHDQLNDKHPALPTQPPKPGDKTHHPTRSYIINGREEFYISSDESGDEMLAEEAHRMEVRDEQEEEEEEVPEEASDPAHSSDDQLEEDGLMSRNAEDLEVEAGEQNDVVKRPQEMSDSSRGTLPTRPPRPGDKAHHPTRAYIINGREEFYISSDESGDEISAVPQRRKEARDEEVGVNEEVPEESSDSPAHHSDDQLDDEDDLRLQNGEEPSLPTEPPKPGDTVHHPTRAYIINGREEFYISSDESGDEMPAEKLHRMEVRDEEVEVKEEVPEEESDTAVQSSEEHLADDDLMLRNDEDLDEETEDHSVQEKAETESETREHQEPDSESVLIEVESKEDGSISDLVDPIQDADDDAEEEAQNNVQAEEVAAPAEVVLESHDSGSVIDSYVDSDEGEREEVREGAPDEQVTTLSSESDKTSVSESVNQDLDIEANELAAPASDNVQEEDDQEETSREPEEEGNGDGGEEMEPGSEVNVPDSDSVDASVSEPVDQEVDMGAHEEVDPAPESVQEEEDAAPEDFYESEDLAEDSVVDPLLEYGLQDDREETPLEPEEDEENNDGVEDAEPGSEENVWDSDHDEAAVLEPIGQDEGLVDPTVFVDAETEFEVSYEELQREETDVTKLVDSDPVECQEEEEEEEEYVEESKRASTPVSEPDTTAYDFDHPFSGPNDMEEAKRPSTPVSEACSIEADCDHPPSERVQSDSELSGEQNLMDPLGVEQNIQILESQEVEPEPLQRHSTDRTSYEMSRLLDEISGDEKFGRNIGERAIENEEEVEPMNYAIEADSAILDDLGSLYDEIGEEEISKEREESLLRISSDDGMEELTDHQDADDQQEQADELVESEEDELEAEAPTLVAYEPLEDSFNSELRDGSEEPEDDELQTAAPSLEPEAELDEPEDDDIFIESETIRVYQGCGIVPEQDTSGEQTSFEQRDFEPEQEPERDVSYDLADMFEEQLGDHPARFPAPKGRRKRRSRQQIREENPLREPVRRSTRACATTTIDYRPPAAFRRKRASQVPEQDDDVVEIEPPKTSPSPEVLDEVPAKKRPAPRGRPRKNRRSDESEPPAKVKKVQEPVQLRRGPPRRARLARADNAAETNEPEVVFSNFTYGQHVQDRGTQIPIGIQRKPFEFFDPRRLPGQKRRAGDLTVHLSGKEYEAMEEERERREDEHMLTMRSLRKVRTGSKYQADLPAYDPERLTGEDDTVREELTWISPEESSAIDDYETFRNVFYRAIWRQFESHIPLDAVLNHVMRNDYDMLKSLETIDQTLKTLPQQMKRLTTGQAERAGEALKAETKSVRAIQKKAMRNYHIAEVCFYMHKVSKFYKDEDVWEHPPCTCYEPLCVDFLRYAPRIDCTNCTRFIRNRPPSCSSSEEQFDRKERLCLICLTYEELSHGMLRPAEDPVFNSDDLEKIRDWNRMENELGVYPIPLEEYERRAHEKKMAAWLRKEFTDEERDTHVYITLPTVLAKHGTASEKEKYRREKQAELMRPSVVPHFHRCVCWTKEWYKTRTRDQEAFLYDSVYGRGLYSRDPRESRRARRRLRREMRAEDKRKEKAAEMRREMELDPIDPRLINELHGDDDHPLPSKRRRGTRRIINAYSFYIFTPSNEC